MRGDLLMDTGALVSILDRSQSRHDEFLDFYQRWEGAVVSTEAVLTEASHLLMRVHGGARTCLDFFIHGGATLIPPDQRTLQRCRDLIHKYSDLPMDYADATLVALAEELGTALVFTTDRRDFGIYRIGAGKGFEILP